MYTCSALDLWTWVRAQASAKSTRFPHFRSPFLFFSFLFSVPNYLCILSIWHLPQESVIPGARYVHVYTASCFERCSHVCILERACKWTTDDKKTNTLRKSARGPPSPPLAIYVFYQSIDSSRKKNMAAMRSYAPKMASYIWPILKVSYTKSLHPGQFKF